LQKKALDQGFTKYTPSSGIPEFKKAVVERLKLDHGLEYEPSQCMIGLGAKQTIFNALQVLCNPGDEVIIPAPYWVSYPVMAELADAKPVIAPCPKEVNFKLTPDILKRSLTAKSKVLILNSPNNPTGEVYTEQELRDIATVLERTAVWIISDDIYDKLVFADNLKIAPHVATLNAKIKDRILIANSLSKTYSMTGWRLGSLVGDKKIIDACSNYQSQSASCAVSFAQKAGVEALLGPQEMVEKSRLDLMKRRDQIYRGLKDIPGVDLNLPQGAFYAWVDISKCLGKKIKNTEVVIDSSNTFSAELLERVGVAMVPGAEFGMEGYGRISFAVSPAKIEDAIKRIRRFSTDLMEG
jgi:aspartate aminotransferase